MKVLIINGSHREGNTDIIIDRVKDQLQLMTQDIRILVLRDIEMKMPDGCVTCADSGICPHIKDEFSEMIEPTIRDYDVYIIATPTWSDGVTPLTKIFWDRIVSWCSDERMYLKNKKIALITHGMADVRSWNNVISWVKSVCKWELCDFAGSLAFQSGRDIGDVQINNQQITDFIQLLVS